MDRLQKNINSYVTVEEADKLITEMYSNDDSLANYWLYSEQDDKEDLLLRSMDEIESCILQGRKASFNQPLQFPRTRRAPYTCFLIYYYDLETDYNGLSEVQKAQVVNALEILNIQIGQQATGKYLSSLRAEKILRSWLTGSCNSV